MLNTFGVKYCDMCHKVINPDDYTYAQRRFCSKPCATKFYKIQSHNKLVTSNFQYRRFYILRRDNFRCVLCGASPITEGIKLRIDHIYPKRNTNLSILQELPERLMTLCDDCNSYKSSKLLSEELIKTIIERNIIRQKEEF